MEQKAIEYIHELQAQDPSPEANWYCIAAVAFTSANQGPLVAHVYRAAIAPYSSSAETRRLILRRMKESLINGAFVYGDPRLLNAFFPLVEAIPDKESIDQTVLRRGNDPYGKAQRGEAYMRRIFGADMDPFLAKMDEFWPDLRALAVDYVYGLYQSELSILDEILTSQITISSLVPMDVVKQLSWHMRGMINMGGSRNQLAEAMEIATRICEIIGVDLKTPIPNVDETIYQEKLL